MANYFSLKEKYWNSGDFAFKPISELVKKKKKSIFFGNKCEISHKKETKGVIYKMMQMYHVHGVNVGGKILLV